MLNSAPTSFSEELFLITIFLATIVDAEVWEVENERGERMDFRANLSPFRVLFLDFLATINNCATLHAFQIWTSTIHFQIIRKNRTQSGETSEGHIIQTSRETRSS